MKPLEQSLQRSPRPSRQILGRLARSAALACLPFALPVTSLLCPAHSWAQSASVYYICPGNVFTNTLTTKEAEQKGCKVREATQPTTIAGPKPRPSSSAAPSGSSGADRVDAAEQRARDSDAKRILEQELNKEEEALEALRREFRNGEPERRGDERNYQKYLDRVAELKAAISRKEADVAAIRREIAKLPQ